MIVAKIINYALAYWHIQIGDQYLILTPVKVGGNNILGILFITVDYILCRFQNSNFIVLSLWGKILEKEDIFIVSHIIWTLCARIQFLVPLHKARSMWFALDSFLVEASDWGASTARKACTVQLCRAAQSLGCYNSERTTCRSTEVPVLLSLSKLQYWFFTKPIMQLHRSKWIKF